jgi:quinol monooxygenase YgiN
MFIVFVSVHVKQEFIDAFIDATNENALQSRLEAGIARFDFLQDIDDRTKFILVEVYRTREDAARHKDTIHYRTWRDGVADMMAEARTSVKFSNISPDDAMWR